MKIINDRAIVLKTRRPHLVTEEASNYKILEEAKGVYKIAIPWGLQEAQLLAKLKVKDIPSPMTRDYELRVGMNLLPTKKKRLSF